MYEGRSKSSWTDLEANTVLILHVFWTELGQAENFLIAPRTYLLTYLLKLTSSW